MIDEFLRKVFAMENRLKSFKKLPSPKTICTIQATS